MVKFNTFVRGNWIADNHADTLRSFDISAEVQMNANKEITTLVNGVVKKDGTMVGVFSANYPATVPAFTPQTADSGEAILAYQTVVAFVSDVIKEAVDNPPFNSNH